MEPLVERTLTSARGFTYRYYTSQDKDPNVPALLLCHGFPDTAHLWRPLLPYLTSLTNRLLIPDLLGFGGTSKPAEPMAYEYHEMVEDLIDICNAEQIWQVVSIGHDHGAGMAARVYNHAPQRVAGLVLLNVGYQVPEKQEPFDLDALNRTAAKIFGYPIFEYWNFLTSPDAAALLNRNLDRLFDCAHAGTFEEKKSLYCVPGAMRDYISNHSTPRISTKPYAADGRLKQRWMSEFQAGGLAGPLCWYTSRIMNAQLLSDKRILDANITVRVPTLFIGCDEDTVCRKELINGPRDAGLLPDLVVQIMEGVAHWPMYEDPEQTATLIMDFLRNKHL